MALVVSEWSVPGRDGLGLCVALQGKVPLLLYSQRAGPAEIERALSLGALDVISKADPIAVVLAKVERHLKRS